MFVRWQSRTRRRPDGLCGDQIDLGDGKMWKAIPGTNRLDVHRAAILCESVRVEGKPRQKHVAYLGSITDGQIMKGHDKYWNELNLSSRCGFWHGVEAKLDRLGKSAAKDRKAIEASIAKVVPRPTKAQFRADKKRREEFRKQYPKTFGNAARAVSVNA